MKKSKGRRMKFETFLKPSSIENWPKLSVAMLFAADPLGNFACKYLHLRPHLRPVRSIH